MRVPFKIFPSIGYKNSQFQAVASMSEITIQIAFPDGQEVTVRPTVDQTLTLTKLTKPGTYRAYATINDQFHEQHFQVLDGIRIGSSELKQVYVFDQVPYAFFVMRDRMHIQHELTEGVWEENFSPSAIVQLDANFLLFKTELGTEPKTGLKLTNVGIYSLDSFSIVAELLDHYAWIWLDNPRKRIWLYNLTESRIVCLSTQPSDGTYWQELLNVSTEPDWKLQAGNAQLFAKTSATINIINTEKLQVISIPQQPNLAVDETGACYQIVGRSLNLVNTAASNPIKSLFQVPATATLQTKGFYFVGEEFKLSIIPTEFDRQFEEAVATLNPYFGQKALLPTPVVCSFEPSSCTILPGPNGLYVLQKEQQQTLTGVWHGYRDKVGLERFIPISETAFSNHLMYCQAEGESVTLIKSSAESITIPTHFQKALVAKHDAQTLLILGSHFFAPLNPQIEQHQIVSTETNRHYLLVRYNGRIDLFGLASSLTELLTNVALVDGKMTLSGSILWYYPEPGQPAGYNLATENQIPFNTLGERQSLLTQAHVTSLSATHATIDTVLIDRAEVKTEVLVTSTGVVRASVPGILVAVSTDLTKVISRRGQELYVLTYQQEVQNYTSQTVVLPLVNYEESYMAPDGKFLVLKDKTQRYQLYNIATGETSTYLSGKFLAFDKSGSLLFEGTSVRSARLLDPVTFEEITSLSYHHYRFLSPDGKLFAQTVPEKKYYAGLFGGYITPANIQWLENILDHGYTLEDRTQEKIRLVQQSRHEFYTKHAAYFISQGIKEADELRSRHVYETRHLLQIGIVGTSTVAEVKLHPSTTFFNYAAFSFDNEWITAVGKAPGCGFVTVAKLAFDSDAEKLVVKSYFESDVPETATWVCGVSTTKQFAAYTSNGYTYILELGDALLGVQPTRDEIHKEFVPRENTVVESSGIWNRINGKNFLCYSPTGRFMALSEQRYNPITLGGTGHQDSNAVHVVNAQEYTLVDSFHGHGGEIKVDKTKKLVFASFSEDERNLMTMSADGVVIIRRIAGMA